MKNEKFRFFGRRKGGIFGHEFIPGCDDEGHEIVKCKNCDCAVKGYEIAKALNCLEELAELDPRYGKSLRRLRSSRQARRPAEGI